MRKNKNQEKEMNELRFRAREFFKKSTEMIENIPIEDIQKLIYELNIHQMRLEMQNEELRKACEELKNCVQRQNLEMEEIKDQLRKEKEKQIWMEEERRKADQKLQAIIDASPSAIFALDTKAKVIMWSKAAERIFGWNEREVMGIFNPIVPDDRKSEFWMAYNKVLQGKKLSDHQFRRRKKDGSLIDISVSTAPLKDSEGHIVGTMGVVTDITERRQADKALRESEKELKIRNKIADIFLRVPDEEMYSEVLKFILRVMESEYGVFGYIDAHGSLVCPTISREVWSQCHIPKKDYVFPREAWGGIWGRALRERKTIYTNTPSRIPEGHIPIFRALDVPIIYQGRIIGNLLVANKETDYIEKDIKLLESIADYIAPVLDARLQKGRQEKALRESEEKFKNLAEQSPNMIFINQNGKVIYANKRCEEIMGYKREEFYSPDFDFLILIDSDHRELVQSSFNSYMKGEEIGPLKYRLIAKNGKKIEGIFNTKIIDYNGEKAILSTITDVTKLREVEEALRESEEKYRQLFNTETDAVMILDAETLKVIDVNPAALQLYGYTKEEFLQLPLLEITAEPEKTKDSIYQALCGKLSKMPICYHRKKDGRIFPVEISASAFSLSGRKVMCKVIRDITERKKAEEAVQAEKERAQKYLNIAPSIILALDRNGNISLLNEEGCNILECQQADVIGKNWFENFLPEKVRKNIRAVFKKVIAGEVQPIEYFESSILTKTGKEKIIRWHSSIIKDEEGKIIGTLSSGEDITEIKQAQEALRENEEHFRSLITAASDTIIMMDLRGKILYVNEAGKELLGVDDVDNIIGRNFFSFMSRESLASAHELMETALKEGIIKNKEYLLIKENGEKVPVELSESLIKDSNNRPFRLMAIIRNIADRKQIEEQLNKSFQEIRDLKDQLHAENVFLREEIKLKHEHGDFVGQSYAIKNVLVKAEQVADTDSTILIFGETGTGKELLAHIIHKLSRRKDKPLVKVNCAALPPTLIESELFGHEKGAFTGALSKQIGRFEIANGGTIFLDEIGELSSDLQVKLLRVLQEGQFERIGSPKTIKANVRIIAATNRDLDEAVKNGKFREDLYYRLNVFPIMIPPLRQRKEDIPLLIWSFIKEFERKMGKRIESIPHKSMKALKNYDWPGNVRELRNTIERAMILSKGSTLYVDVPKISNNAPLHAETLEEIEKRHIIEILNKTKWRISGENGAAEILGLKPTTLHSKMSKLGIKRKNSY